MDKKKGIIFTLLLLLTVVFIAFVAIMQHNFLNQESVVNDSTNTEPNSSELESDLEDTDTKDTPTDDEQVKESEEQEITFSNRVVTADLLNVRSGPGPEFEISGIVTLDQEVEVEDNGKEWVKITTEDFTGYVNEKHLSKEE